MELNQKLAEYFRIEPEVSEIVITGVETASGKKIKGGRREEYIYPDFTHSLDLCFEHLVPKLDKIGYSYELLQWNNGQHKAILNKRCEGWTQTYTDVVAETPSMALCLAIEKLIDETKPDK